MKNAIQVACWAILTLTMAKANARVSLLGLNFNAPQVNDKANVSSPQTGDIVFDSSDGKFWGFDVSTWISLSGSSGNTASSVDLISNIGVSAGVSSNSLNIALTDASGSNCSSSSACIISFRNANATTGSYTQATITSPLSMTVHASSTLGQTSGANQYVWVSALNDGGNVDLCVSGVGVFFDSSLNASTQESAGASSGSTLYCGQSHTGSMPTRPAKQKAYSADQKLKFLTS